jgi:hypothetical protein
LQEELGDNKKLVLTGYMVGVLILHCQLLFSLYDFPDCRD